MEVIRKLKITKWDTSKGVKEMMLLLKDGTTKKLELFETMKKYDVKAIWLEECNPNSFF